MGVFVLSNTRWFLGGVDLTSRNNKLEIATECSAEDVTTFLDTDDETETPWKEVIGGLFDTSVAGEGLWEAGDTSKVDDAMWAGLGTVSASSACPRGAALGDLAYLTKLLRPSYKLGGTVGEVAPWSASGKGSWPVPRGVVAHPPGTARSSSGAGTAVEHKAVPAGQHLYAALHVLSVSGTGTPTLTVTIESDAADDFSGAETTQISFAAKTAIGDEVLRTAGPITDTWYRPAFTISGTTPSFLFLVTLGVAV